MAYWHDKDTGLPAEPFAENAYFDWEHLAPLIVFVVVTALLLIVGKPK